VQLATPRWTVSRTIAHVRCVNRAAVYTQAPLQASVHRLQPWLQSKCRRRVQAGISTTRK
jgi:hypothetical protein